MLDYRHTSPRAESGLSVFFSCCCDESNSRGKISQFCIIGREVKWRQLESEAAAHTASQEVEKEACVFLCVPSVHFDSGQVSINTIKLSLLVCPEAWLLGEQITNTNHLRVAQTGTH